MTNKLFALCLLPLAALAGERKVNLYTAIDLGRLESGYDLQKGYDPSGLALNRTYVDIGFQEQLDERYMLSIGVGGIFWKAFEGSGGNPEDKVIKFGPGISNAFMKWTPTENLSLTFGYFPYKYNMAAKNLGEYLFRTEAYPTIIYTGGWSWMNDAQYRTVGAKLTFETGTVRHDLGLFSEYFNSPIYDITPAYITTWKPSPAFTLGGAASLHRFITPTPQTKKDLTKSYQYYENFYFPEVTAKRKYNVDIDSYIGNRGSNDVTYSAGTAPNLDSLKAAIWAEDGATLQSLYNIGSAAAIPLKMDTSALSQRAGRPAELATKLRADIIQQAIAEGSDSAAYFGNPNNAGKAPQAVSFDLAAVKLLAFFELDFNALLGLERSEMGAFNLYGEVAQLGVKNYPIFYTKYAERMPIMMGFSMPTFGLLDHLSLELEYLKNPTVESIASTYDKLDLPPDEEFRYETHAKDDYKWSVHASRGFAKFLSLHVQVANDHMRLKDGFARPQYVPVTNEPSHWYWLTRIQWML